MLPGNVVRCPECPYPHPVDEPVDSSVHEYVSTACQHGHCDRCRRVCKFCPAECGHDCHNQDHSYENPGAETRQTGVIAGISVKICKHDASFEDEAIDLVIDVHIPRAELARLNRVILADVQRWTTPEVTGDPDRWSQNLVAVRGERCPSVLPGGRQCNRLAGSDHDHPAGTITLVDDGAEFQR